MKKTIYVIFGSAGEYSDRREWSVIACTDKTTANALVFDLTKEGNRIRALPSASSYGSWDKIKDPNPLDPNFTWDYSGFNYYYHTVGLIEGEAQ